MSHKPGSAKEKGYYLRSGRGTPGHTQRKTFAVSKKYKREDAYKRRCKRNFLYSFLWAPIKSVFHISLPLEKKRKNTDATKSSLSLYVSHRQATGH